MKLVDKFYNSVRDIIDKQEQEREDKVDIEEESSSKLEEEVVDVGVLIGVE